MIMFKGGAPPVADEAALGMSFDELAKGQWRIANSARLLLLPLLPALLKGLPASLVASPVQVVGNKGTDGGFSGFVLVVIILKTFGALSSRRVRDSFPIRPCTRLVDAEVASLQPAVFGDVLVLLEYFLSNPLQHVVEAGHNPTLAYCP